MKVEVEGADILLIDLEKMMPADTDVSIYLSKGAEPIAAEMRRTAPVGKTGRLKNAINIGGVRNGKNGKTITIGIHRKDFGQGDYYPAFVEYGHGGPRPAPPHPFIRPAFDWKSDEAWTAIKQAALADLQQKGL